MASQVPQSDGRIAELITGEVAITGGFPSQDYNQAPNVAGTTAGDELFTTGDISGRDSFGVENRSGFAVEVKVTKDGTFNANQPAQSVLLSDAITGNTVTSLTIPANKTGTFTGKFKNYRVVQAATGAIAAGEIISSWGNE